MNRDTDRTGRRIFFGKVISGICATTGTIGGMAVAIGNDRDGNNSDEPTEIVTSPISDGTPPSGIPDGIPNRFWNELALWRAPVYKQAQEYAPSESDSVIRPIFYESLPYRGTPTRTFAYFGVPKDRPCVGGMVLLHGGGGTAFAHWVKLWNERGYAAIAMDLCGSLPLGADGQPHPHHPEGGPPGWGGFDQLDEPDRDQWAYHAVANAILAHSLLRSIPEVPTDRIGLTGISWGGYLTCIVAGVDPRFRFAIPVYGCGFINESPLWPEIFTQPDGKYAERWMTRWDPSVYLPHAMMPILWVNGTNDFAFPLDAYQKSYQLPPGERTLCIPVRMPHYHFLTPEEIRRFADTFCCDGVPLAKIDTPEFPDTTSDDGNNNADGRSVAVTFNDSDTISVVRAELNYTADTGVWANREWHTLPAELGDRRATARLPDNAVTFYFNLFDEQNCIVSSERLNVNCQTISSTKTTK